jgi:hypothetical protein
VTKAEEIYERVQALTAEGLTKADAFRKLAEELGKPLGSVRGAYYQFTRKRDGGSSKRRTRETTPADALENAKAILARAVEAIDEEVEAAKDRAEEAAAEYEALKASASDRKHALEAKITALEA